MYECHKVSKFIDLNGAAQIAKFMIWQHGWNYVLGGMYYLAMLWPTARWIFWVFLEAKKKFEFEHLNYSYYLLNNNKRINYTFIEKDINGQI